MNAKPRIIYVARDIERALGTTPSADYVVVSNNMPYAETVKEQYPDFVHLVGENSGIVLDTHDLLKSDIVLELMADSNAVLLVFKNNPLIETMAKENGWTLLNPPSALAEKVENKITQAEWLGELADKYLPPHTVAPAKELIWKKEPLIVQWAHGHTGDGTTLVNSAEELRGLQKKFPDRMARASSFVRGPSFTVNAVVAEHDVLVGNPSYQITGLPPFTDNSFTTVGNDWSLPHSLLSEAETAAIENMSRAIGEKLRADGWRGLFGIDVMRDDDRDLPDRQAGRIFLIEVNTRQPASTAFESFLQKENRRQGVKGLTVFEAHLEALSNDLGAHFQGKDSQAMKIDQSLIPVNDGAQIVQRVTKSIESMSDDVVGSLELAGYMTIIYANTEYNADLLRIQSMRGIMEADGKLNARGKEILEVISNRPD